jgi:hypothetical protein
MDPSYYAVEMYFMSLTFFGAFMSVVLARTDFRLGLGLNLSERHVLERSGVFGVEEEIPLSPQMDITRGRSSSLGAESLYRREEMQLDHDALSRFPGSQPPYTPPFPVSMMPSYDPPLEPLMMFRSHLMRPPYSRMRNDTEGSLQFQRRSTISARQEEIRGREASRPVAVTISAATGAYMLPRRTRTQADGAISPEPSPTEDDRNAKNPAFIQEETSSR